MVINIFQTHKVAVEKQSVNIMNMIIQHLLLHFSSLKSYF